MSNAANVTAGKPSITGSVYRAVYSDSLVIPTSATEELSSDFKDLGYISDAGLINSNSPESDEIKAWGGDTVLILQTEKPDTFKFVLLETGNENVLEAVYPSVTKTDDGLKVVASSDVMDDACWVFNMVLSGGKKKRIVVPRAQISEIGDISYTDSDAVGYELTISAVPYTDADGVTGTHFEYIK